MTEDRGRLRVIWWMGCAAVLAAVLVGKLVYWQVVEHKRISLLAPRQHQVTFKLPSQRGRIFDRNGQLIATDTPVANVVADPSLIPATARPRVAAGLAPVLGMAPADVLKHLQVPLKFEYVKRGVAKETADRITAMRLTGIGLEADVRRSYLVSTAPGEPADTRSLAANLLRFVNAAGAGQYGVEP